MVTDGSLCFPVQELKVFYNLRYLDLYGTSGITSDNIAVFTEFKQLQWLDLGDTSVSDTELEFLGTLVQLKGLELGELLVTDAGVAHLRSLQQVRVLNLRSTAVTNKSFAVFFELVNIQVIVLGGTEVTPEGCRAFNCLRPSVHLGQTGYFDQQHITAFCETE